MSRRRVRPVAAALVAALVAVGSCSPAKRTAAADPRDCFPAEARRWIASDKANAHAAAPGSNESESPRRATIYVDRSGSMVGYIRAASNTERPLQDLVETLPATLRGLGVSETAFRPFGTDLSDEMADGRPLANEAAFVCRQGSGGCDNRESRLDKVLAAVRDRPHELAIIVSDLWFENPADQATGIAALQPLLADLLHEGRMIALYGLAAPFDGKIYDLPSGGAGTVSLPYRGRHPLFFMVVGPRATVLDMDRVLEGGGSRQLAEGRRTGAIRRALFTTDPVKDEMDLAEPLSAPGRSRVRLSKFEAPGDVEIQRFVLASGLPSPRDRTDAGAPAWSGPDARDFLPDAVWAGPITTRTRVWRRTGRTCSASGWAAQAPGDTGWSAEDDTRATFALDPGRFAGAMSQPGAYLVVGEVTRTSVGHDDPSAAWLRGPWDLAPGDGGRAAATPPDVFPTLNLSEFARIMEAALADAAHRRQQPIVGFSIMVKTEK